MHKLKSFFIGAALAVVTTAATQAQSLPADYEKSKADAEKLFAESSFARAHETYRSVNLTNLPTAEQRWVQFRLADTQWRSEAATQRADTTKIDQAREQLEKLVRDVQREEERDRVWVEVQESLGDFWWTRSNVRNWGQAWQHYNATLEWWAGQSDLAAARARYLGIVWKAASPPGRDRNYYYGYYGNMLPLPVLENTLKIVQTEDDQARAHYLVAMTLRQQGGQDQRARVPEEFEAALKIGRKTDWYDDALYQYAEWMLGQGRIIPLENGGWRNEPDYVKALELFRRLIREFNEGETRYWRQAQNQISGITEPQLGASVAHVFLPDSEIQYHLNWRNVKRVDFALYPVDLPRDVNLSAIDEQRRTDWLHTINLAGREKIKEWTYDTKDAGDHKPGNESPRYDGKLKPGAYVLEARGANKTARDLVLVSDVTLVLKTSGKQALIYVCNALNSAPVAGAKVKLWERWNDGSRWQARDLEKAAGTNGIAVFELTNRPDRNIEVFAAAISNDRQAFSTGNSYWQRGERESWRIYAFTDRPAYRPGEKVEWKLTARRDNGSVYSTPSSQVIEFEITDPRGAKVAADKLTLNEFGSASRSVDVTDKMPLGEYRVAFWDQGRKNGIGNATLFRLEEYKVPEFKVTVQTPEEDSGKGIPPVSQRKKTFRLGETVEVAIQADYYFGGPVANASVEVLVHQNPYWIAWPKPRDFPWFYEDMDEGRQAWRRSYGGGQVVKRETIKTDATGKATLTFETPANAGQDFEYRIEARVTDASRRQIVGNGNVRVTRQRYYINAQPDHNLYKPQDKVRVEFQAQDANSQPVQAEGTVKVTRDYWYEIWLAPDGREVKGDELKRLQTQSMIWPPPPERPDQKGWQLKFRGYEHDDILTRPVKTGAEGKGELTFTPEREGYYRVAWTSEDAISNLKSTISNPIRADTTVWIASSASTDIGYRHGGVEIIVDKDTFRVGQRAPVMIAAPTSDRYVLFTVEGEDLHSYQLVHVTGTVKLIEMEIAEQHVPNIFLSAALVHDRQFFADTKQVVVPPTKNFLTVEVKPDRPQYQPRDEGTLTVTTKNDEGKPVSAEVALALVDESVFYIQSDYAGDPRQFFFGTKRPQRVQTSGTMNWKSYAKLVEWEGKDLIDDRERDSRRRQGGMGGAGGGAGGSADYFADELGRRELQEGDAKKMSSRSNVGGIAQFRLANSAAPAAVTAMEMAAGAVLEGRQADPEPVVIVRSDFRSTILWQPDVKTDQNGHATVKVKYPDSLTGWKATARVASAANQFGIADTTTRTKQPLMVRLQAPRFFVVGDQVTLSAVINNNTDEPMSVTTVFETGTIAGNIKPLIARDPNRTLERLESEVPANGEVRVDWPVTVFKPGPVTIKVTTRGSKHSDAMEKTYLAHEHGIEKFITKAGKVRGNDITVKLDLPKARKPDSTTLTVQVTPSMAVTMLDALPYLIDYPYGCTEQTMSRFLPVVITAKTLRDVGLDPEDVMGRLFGGIESRAGTSPASPRQGTQKNLAELDAMVKAGLERLYDFQRSDGGWGWWKQGEGDRWMTAYVVWGFSLARDAGVPVKEDALRRGVEFLDRRLVEEEENPDMQAWMLHAMSVYYAPFKDRLTSQFAGKASDNLWTRRDQLNAYTRALFALASHHLGKAEQAKTLIANLENGVKRDDRPDTSVLVGGTPNNAGVMGTAHWGEDGIYWRWSEGGLEATAFALRALLAIDPKSKLIEPVTNWLIKNRRGAQWSNTRDTAIVVLAMNDYLRTSGELKPEMEFEVLVNGKSVATRKVSGADVFSAPSRFTVDTKLIRDGANEIRIKRKGDGPVYFAAEAKFFSLEEPIPAAGNEIFAKREYYKLVGRPTLLKGFVYDKVPLKDGESVKSGERIETIITIEAKNNYEYLVFEDLKPAGFEAVEIRSGESLYATELKSGAVERKFSVQSPTSKVQSQVVAGRAAAPSSVLRPPSSALDHTGRTRWVYQELRDRKVALFLDKLPEGVWEIRYDFRAEVPGTFHALPVLGHAMYVPEIRCNGDETRVTVTDSERD